MMSRRSRVLCVVALLCACANARAWDSTDRALQSAWYALHVADYLQTRDIAAQCATNRYHETNVVIGRCPDNEQVTLYFGLTGIAHTAIAANLARNQRRWYHIVTLSISAFTVNRNTAIGLQFRF